MSQTLHLPGASSFAPLAGFRAALLQRLCAVLRHGSLEITLPDGCCVRHRGDQAGPAAKLTLHRWRALRRLFTGGDVAFAEAYGDGDWSSPDLATVIELAAANGTALNRTVQGLGIARLTNRLQHWRHRNSRQGSRRNIIAHYDLGNDFFSAWLDPGMSYSSGIYSDATTTLDAAQAAKQDRAIALLDVRPGNSVLEIGIGWGGLAQRILDQHDGPFTGVTLSPSQLAHAEQRMILAAHAGRADLRLQDYRDIPGRFDRIVSIEMFEAVGEAYWPVFFQNLRDRLARDGVAVLQVITIAEDRYDDYRNSADFIQRHIFPGGMLPSPNRLRHEIAAAGLRLEHAECFGHSYARTLADWHQRFLRVMPGLQAMGLDERFQRLWRYYLAYCEGGFRAGAIDVGLYRIRHAARAS